MIKLMYDTSDFRLKIKQLILPYPNITKNFQSKIIRTSLKYLKKCPSGHNGFYSQYFEHQENDVKKMFDFIFLLSKPLTH